MTSKEERGVSKDLGLMEEDDEDLFEIDLDAVNSIIPQPHNYWENNYFISTGGEALLANCLLPISHISSAIPACNNAVSFLITYPKPFLRDFGFIDEKMKAKFQFQFQT